MGREGGEHGDEGANARQGEGPGKEVRFHRVRFDHATTMPAPPPIRSRPVAET
ncbi:hypothetical protein llg_28860 [Luteolibacter sp. LG18]|nr:hypothetical protein llg_28860 [Luteolibacter sp. LG18]